MAVYWKGFQLRDEQKMVAIKKEVSSHRLRDMSVLLGA
jgi:hypothetical protein